MISGTKRLSINLITSIIGTVVGLGVAFLLTPYLVNRLGKDVYSFFPMANTFTSYFLIIVTALNALAARFITVTLIGGKVEESKEYFSSVFFANILLAAIFIVPISLIIIFLDKLLQIPLGYVAQIKILFSLVFLSFIINLVSSVFGAAVFVKDRIDYKSYQHITTYVIRVSGYLILFLLFQPNIIFVGIVTLSESIANALISFILTKKLLPDYKISITKVKKTAIWNLVSSGVWNSINSLGGNLLSGMMVILANVLISADASGDISLTMTLVNLCTTVISMIVTVFYPRMTREYAKNGSNGLSKETFFSQNISSLIISSPIIVLMLLGFEFYSLWVPGQDASFLSLLSFVCLLPYAIQASMWTITQVFPVTNKLRTPAIIVLCFGVATLLSTIVIHQFNKELIVIPIVSSVLNIIYCVLFVPLYASKLLQTSFFSFLKPLLLGAIANVLTFLICFSIKKYFVINGWLSLFLVAFLFCLIGYLLSSVFCLSPTFVNLIKKRKNIKKEVGDEKTKN